MTRDERQEISRIKWIKNKGKGTVVGCTGFGKTRVALNCLKSIIDKCPTITALVIVPTEALKNQWIELLDSWGLGLNTEVQIINSAIKHEWNTDILCLDECHRFAADEMSKIFSVVKYKYILGLTATFERLDGKHELINKYCPVIDEITLTEAQLNGWISDYKEYQVIIDVDNIDEYKTYNKQFVASFEFFNFSWDKAMSCIGPNGFINRTKLRDEMCPNGSVEERKKVFANITYHATTFMRAVQQRKSFINNHPKKIEIARKIIEARNNSKIITFSNNVKMAESIKIGHVYTGKDSKKKGRMTIEEFKSADSGVLNSVKRADEGLDVPGLSVAIILGLDSSKTRKTQRIGRVVRKEGDKQAEIFNLIINDTVEMDWFKRSCVNPNVITIDEEGLNDVLAGKEPKPYVKKLKEFTFRY